MLIDYFLDTVLYARLAYFENLGAPNGRMYYWPLTCVYGHVMGDLDYIEINGTLHPDDFSRLLVLETQNAKSVVRYMGYGLSGKLFTLRFKAPNKTVISLRITLR